MTNFPFIFGLGFFLRIFVPGLIAGFLVALFRGQTSWFKGLDGITTFILLSGLLGMALRIVYVFVSEFFAGGFMPSWFRVWRVRSLERRFREAETTLKHPPKGNAYSNEGWKFYQAIRFVQLFPIDNAGNRSVVAPTILGNVAASTLSGLFIQYGLGSVHPLALVRQMMFVLTRLWFRLPDRLRQEVSESFAQIEALLGAMTAVVLGSVAFLARGLFRATQLYLGPRPDLLNDVVLGPPGSSVGIAVVLWFVAWVIYEVVVKQMSASMGIYEALFGHVSPAELERVIQQAQQAASSQKETETKESQAGSSHELPR